MELTGLALQGRTVIEIHSSKDHDRKGDTKMNVNKQEIEQLITSMLNQNRLEPEQIPELDLYIDQILMLFEDKLGENRRREKDKILTKSMVNNYSKEKLIRPMRGKKYNREQILQILMICSLKNILSIGDIKQVMTTLMDEGIRAQELEHILEHNRVNRQKLKEGVGDILEKLEGRYAIREMDMTGNGVAAAGSGKHFQLLQTNLRGKSSTAFFVQDENENLVR